MGYTGRAKYLWLVEYNSVTGEPTGNRKKNLSTDPDYIPPFYDTQLCSSGEISISPSFLYFDYQGGTKNITVTSDGDWEVSGFASAGLQPRAGNAGQTVVSVTKFGSNNNFGTSSYINFTLLNGNDTTELNIYQEGNDNNLEPEPL